MRPERIRRIVSGGIPPARLHAALRIDAFGIGRRRPGARRIGAEIELLPRIAGTLEVCPLDARSGPSLLAFLRAYGPRHGWIEQRTRGPVPCFRLPDGGTLGFEPGGQLEYSSPPLHTATALVEELDVVVPPLRAAAADAGIELLAIGLDPVQPIERAPLMVRSERYLRMAEYFARIGPTGAIMMRQSASLQLNLDFQDEPLERWRLLNAAAASLVAMFANSSRYARASTGHRSWRAHTWRTLDPARTGVFDDAGDPVARYLDFALAAPSVLNGPEADGHYLAFGDRFARGPVGCDEWNAHLTTLFPEICPKGYLEVRSIDAIEPEWFAAPIVLMAGITYHGPSRRAAADLLGPADPEALVRAGEVGLRDPSHARTARDLFGIGLEGAAALGPDFVGGRELEVARAFYDRYTRRDRSPADDAEAGEAPAARMPAVDSATRSSPAGRPPTSTSVDDSPVDSPDDTPVGSASGAAERSSPFATPQ